MIPKEILKKIRNIQIRTSHQVDELLAGTWHSAFRGRGIEFEEVRPYQIGDDVRSIDWNVTARAGEPYIKLFREERELAVLLLADMSLSQSFGSCDQTKHELVAELGATLAFSAIKNNDKVGLTLFTDEIEKSLPPQKGARHVLRLIRELLYCQPIGTGTSIRRALEHVNRIAKRRSLVFVISDFQDRGFEQTLKIIRRKHDVVPIVVVDERERLLPSIGIIRLRDAESRELVSIDTSNSRIRGQWAQLQEQQRAQQQAMFRRLRLDPITVHTGQGVVEPLHRYFHQRELRR